MEEAGCGRLKTSLSEMKTRRFGEVLDRSIWPMVIGSDYGIRGFRIVLRGTRTLLERSIDSLQAGKGDGTLSARRDGGDGTCKEGGGCHFKAYAKLLVLFLLSPCSLVHLGTGDHLILCGRPPGATVLIDFEFK